MRFNYLITLILIIISSLSLQARYEVCFNITDENGNPKAGVTFEVYYLDKDQKNYILIGSDTSRSYYFWNLNGYGVNAAFDIQDNYSNVSVPVEKAYTIAIKILSQVIRMDYEGGMYGDALIIIPSNGLWSILPFNSSYSFTAP